MADHYIDAGWTGKPDYLLGSDGDDHNELMTEINRRMAHIMTHGLWNEHGGIGVFHWAQVMQFLPGVLIGFGKFVADLKAIHPQRAEWFDWSRDIVEKARE